MVIESMQWHLDVTFREEQNMTLEKTGAENLNIIRKRALGILKVLEVWKKMSLKKKRY
jgi:predicted transposase YbfD/YdcC